MQFESLLKYRARDLMFRYGRTHGDFTPSESDKNEIALKIQKHLSEKIRRRWPELKEEGDRRQNDLFWLSSFKVEKTV
jgi:hypothetical protein